MTCIILHNNQLKMNKNEHHPYLAFLKSFCSVPCSGIFLMSSQSFSEGKKLQSDHLEFHVHLGLNVMGMTLGQI